jgi:hypothetical protein
MIPILLLFVTATYRPATPTVGDPIAIEYSRPVTIAPSPDFEIVSQQGSRVVVRTFDTKPLTIHATANDGEEVGDVVIGVKSVLAPNDALKPAALRPPRELPPSRTPWIAIAAAALLAALAWAAVVWRARRLARVVPRAPALAPGARFRAAVAQASRAPQRWAALADATRAYLAATRPELGVELTSAELLRIAHDPTVTTILHQGDLEKFSPWGAEPLDFDALAERALELAA